MKFILSLHPFAVLGGGELFTANTWRAMARHDPKWQLLVPLCATPDALTDATPMLCFQIDAAGSVRRSVTCFGRVLHEAAPAATHLWIHQFAASARFYDLCWSAMDAEIFLTSLGCDPLLDSIARTTCVMPQLRALEISGFAASRTGGRGLRADPLTAGVWEDEIREQEPKSHDFAAVGRVLPHKGLDITIRALPRDSGLSLVGDLTLHEAYATHLRACAQGKNVCFTGSLPESEKSALLGSARFLVASSTHRPWGDAVHDQVELLGLVLLEAVAAGTLPICSDVPSFREIMDHLGLGEFVYPEGDVAALGGLLREARKLTESDYRQFLAGARSALRKNYLWDTFATRFEMLTKTSAPEK